MFTPSTSRIALGLTVLCTVCAGVEAGRSLQSGALHPSTSYSEPRNAKVTIVFAGVNALPSSEIAGKRTHEEARTIELLRSAHFEESLNRIISQFFKGAAVQFPDLGIRVLKDPSTPILRELQNIAIAAMPINQVHVLKARYALGEQRPDTTLFISLPIFLLHARTMELIYCKPLMLRVFLEAGIELESERAREAVIQEVERYYRQTLDNQAAMTILHDSLKRGAHADPSKSLYDFPVETFSFSENATAPTTGFNTVDRAVTFIREAAMFFLSEKNRVAPPISKEAAHQLQKAIVKKFSTATVSVTEAEQLIEFEGNSAKLSTWFPAALITLNSSVKTALNWTKETRDFRYGNIGVQLQFSTKQGNGTKLHSRAIADFTKVQIHKTELDDPLERHLMAAAFKATKKITTELPSDIFDY